MEQLWLPTFTPYDVYNVIETDGEYELVPTDCDSEDLEVIMEEIKMSDEDIAAFNADPKRFLLDRDCWALVRDETEEEWCERTGEKTTEMLLAEGYSWNAIQGL
jgi:hypothetical protein